MSELQHSVQRYATLWDSEPSTPKILASADLVAIPNRELLIILYTGAFLFAMAAFMIMALQAHFRVDDRSKRLPTAKVSRQSTKRNQGVNEGQPNHSDEKPSDSPPSQ